MNEPKHRKLKRSSSDHEIASQGFFRGGQCILLAYIRAIQMQKILENQMVA